MEENGKPTSFASCPPITSNRPSGSVACPEQKMLYPAREASAMVLVAGSSSRASSLYGQNSTLPVGNKCT